VPTISEQGLAGFQADVWWGVMTRAGTPEPVLQRINQLVNEVLRSPEVIKRLEAQGASVVGGSAAQFARFFSAERATWQKVIADAKIKID
jgi:tripartite-type tricarboxylate transporter receptor subunit TctC